MTNTKINFAKNPTVVEYESNRRIDMEEVVEHCQCNERLVPAENSSEYYEIINDIKQIDQEDFEENCSGLNLGLCLVHGFAGLWDGPSEGGKVMEVNDYYDLIKCVDGCDDIKVYIDKDGLHIAGYHHDGTNTYDIRPLTKKGIKYWENNAVQSKEVHHHLLETKGYLKKVNTYLF